MEVLTHVPNADSPTVQLTDHNIKTVNHDVKPIEGQSLHTVIDPPILYWGTPVVLITTLNEDGTPNIAPMSSAFWLGDMCVLGLARYSKTTGNILRTKQCVLNLASDKQIHHVNALARTTGTYPVPERKIMLGYSHVKDKFSAAGLTPEASHLIDPPRVRECPVQMEAEYVGELDMDFAVAIKVRVKRVHILDELRLPGFKNRVNPDAWKPMIMSFQKLYGLGYDQIGESKLAKIDEDLYKKL